MRLGLPRPIAHTMAGDWLMWLQGILIAKDSDVFPFIGLCRQEPRFHVVAMWPHKSTSQWRIRAAKGGRRGERHGPRLLY